MTEKFNKKIAYDILRIRLGQIVINEEYKKGNFKIPIHLAFGHESIAVAISNIMENNDKLILSHRNIAYNLAREGSLKPILDEYFLKPTGLMKGQFGSMNLINPSKGVVYSSSILGNNFSVEIVKCKVTRTSGIYRGRCTLRQAMRVRKNSCIVAIEMRM